MIYRKPTVAVSVLNWNQPELTIDCVEQVNKQTFNPRAVIVVDNDSRRATLPFLNESKGLEVIRSPENLGYAGGHQLAVDRSLILGVDLIWLLNNDVKLGPRSLEYLVQAYLEKGDALYGSMQKGIQLSLWKVENGSPRFGQMVNINKEDEDIVQVANLSGASLLVPLHVIRSHGFMDPDFFLYGEETDYCLRLLERAVPSYLVKHSVIEHSSRGSTKANDRLKEVAGYYHTRNHLLLARKHQGLAAFVALTLSYLRTWLFEFIKGNSIRGVRFKAVFDSWAGRSGKTLRPENYI